MFYFLRYSANRYTILLYSSNAVEILPLLFLCLCERLSFLFFLPAGLAVADRLHAAVAGLPGEHQAI